MNLEKLTEKDLEQLAELFKQFWGESTSLEKMRSIFFRLFDNPAYILLAAKQNSRLIGFAMGIICEELYGDCKPFMVVEDLIVDRDLRRSGVGAALIKELEKNAIEKSCCQISLVTETTRKEAVQFYESMGYKSEPYRGFKKRLVDNVSG